MPQATPSVFFSYARSDSGFVLEVANALRAEGRLVWVDQLDIPKGARWDVEVEKALKASDCLLAVLSPASAQSQNVQDEVSYALDEKRTVLPILLRACSIPFRLKRLQYIDFTGDFDAPYRQLRAALDALGTRATPADAPPAAMLQATSAPAPEPRHAGTETRTAPAPAPAADGGLGGRGTAAPQRFPTGIAVAVAVVTVAALAGGYALWGRDDAVRESDPTAAGSSTARVEAAPTATPPSPTAALPTEVALNEKPVPTPAASGVVSDAQVKEWVGRYMTAQNSANPAELLRFYAERVDYFDQKGVGRDFILKDKQSYYRRWPQVDNRLVGPVRVERPGGDRVALASYDIEYRVSNPARADSKAGSAHDELELRLVDGELLIVAQRQRVSSTSARAN